MTTIFGAVATGIIWSLLSQAIRLICQILGLVILARILPASDFGVIAMATFVTGFALIIRDFGTAAAVIQRPDVNDQFLDSLFWFNLLVGIGLALLLSVLSFVAAVFFSEHRLQNIICLLALAVPIGALSQVHQALFERESNFKPVAIVESLAAITGLVFSVLAAWEGWGVYSLIVQTLIPSLIITVGLWKLNPWRPKGFGRVSEIKVLFNFSGNLVGFNVLNYLTRNVDNMLVGRILGATDLGFYVMAYRLMLFPIQNISNVVARALFPAFSRIQMDSRRLANAYIRATAAILLISAPLMLGMFALREPLILAILGSHWLPVAKLMVWLTPIGLLQSLGTTVGCIYMATGRTDLMFRWGVIASVVTVSAFCLGIQWGLQGIVIGYAVASGVLFLPSLMIPLKIINLSVTSVLVNLLPSLIIATVMAFSVSFINQWWDAFHKSPILHLSLVIALGISCYGILSFVVQRNLLIDVLHTFRRGHNKQ
jgi:O-antigen/teichoic acid export membrane protein